ncbi:hypothetical protein D9M71_784690 [compost metagenome]
MLSDAMIADKGRVFLTGVPDKFRLVIKVNEKLWCSEDLDLKQYSLPATGIGQFKVTCTPSKKIMADHNE